MASSSEDLSEETHPLHTPWTLTYYDNNVPGSWKDKLIPVYTFKTVEEFWALQYHVVPPSQMPPNGQYFLFREHIRPEWEDDNNHGGGRLVLMCNDRQRADKAWESFIMLMIGECFGDANEHVNGAVFQLKPRWERIAIWTRDKTHPSFNRHIGKIMKDNIDGKGKPARIQFMNHDDNKTVMFEI